MNRATMTGSLLRTAVLVFSLAGLYGCNKLDMKHYERIQAGMSVEQVKDILGEPAETKSAGGSVLGVGGSVTTMIWKSGDREIRVDFLNNQVVKKDFSNLP